MKLLATQILLPSLTMQHVRGVCLVVIESAGKSWVRTHQSMLQVKQTRSLSHSWFLEMILNTNASNRSHDFWIYNNNAGHQGGDCTLENLAVFDLTTTHLRRRRRYHFVGPAARGPFLNSPLGVNFAPWGEENPRVVKLSVRPSILLNSRDCCSPRPSG
jgi:hypothetical protein